MRQAQLVELCISLFGESELLELPAFIKIDSETPVYREALDALPDETVNREAVENLLQFLKENTSETFDFDAPLGTGEFSECTLLWCIAFAAVYVENPELIDFVLCSFPLNRDTAFLQKAQTGKYEGISVGWWLGYLAMHYPEILLNTLTEGGTFGFNGKAKDTDDYHGVDLLWLLARNAYLPEGNAEAHLSTLHFILTKPNDLKKLILIINPKKGLIKAPRLLGG